MSGERHYAGSQVDAMPPHGRKYTDKAREQGKYSRAALAGNIVVYNTGNKATSVIMVSFLSVNIQ